MSDATEEEKDTAEGAEDVLGDGAESQSTASDHEDVDLHPGAALAWSHGQQLLHPTRETYLDVVSSLRRRGYDMCADLTAVDYLAHPGRQLPPGIRPERFEVVVNLVSLEHRRRVRLRVQVPGADPRLVSLYGIYPTTEAMEREVYDMFGIHFDGHPDLTRILMPEDWEGHPLRKDYPVGRVPVQFKAAPSTR